MSTGVRSGDGVVTITYRFFSSTAVVPSQNPSTAGQPVTFTPTVTGSSPSGTVDFKDGGSSISGCGAQPVGSGTATCTTSSLSVGSHSVTAVYGGDTDNQGSTSSPLTQTVQATTTTGLGSSLNPSTVGQSVTLTATVTGSSPTGTVDFKDGGSSISGCSARPVSGGSASCTTSSLSVGGHTVTAVYGGDTDNQGSTSSPLMQTVNQVATTTALGSSLNPSTFGQSVTVTATVTGSGPTGSVDFKDGGSSISGCNAQPVSGGRPPAPPPA
jgi:hypothetical protein